MFVHILVSIHSLLLMLDLLIEEKFGIYVMWTGKIKRRERNIKEQVVTSINEWSRCLDIYIISSLHLGKKKVGASLLNSLRLGSNAFPSSVNIPHTVNVTVLLPVFFILLIREAGNRRQKCESHHLPAPLCQSAPSCAFGSHTMEQRDESMNLHRLHITLTLFHLRNSNLTSVWPVI